MPRAAPEGETLVTKTYYLTAATLDCTAEPARRAASSEPDRAPAARRVPAAPARRPGPAKARRPAAPASPK